MNKFIGISGYARTGKDHFFKLLQSRYPDLFVRYALADELKREMSNLIYNKYKIDSFTSDPKEKEKIRGEFVSYGAMKRKKTAGTYWTALLDNKIEEDGIDNKIICVTDIRYDEYAHTDELSWLKETRKGILVHISSYVRTTKGKIRYAKAPNDDERRNNPKLFQKANFKFSWSHGNSKEAAGYIDLFINYLKSIDFHPSLKQ